MQWICLDLGSTNIKGMLYNQNMTCLAQQSEPVVYMREGTFVEFDAPHYCETLMALICGLSAHATEITQIVLTGQGESLVVLDESGTPLMPIISWMDGRSEAECEALSKVFDRKTVENVTGQLALLPTWPATKILWLRKNKPEIFKRAATYMLLKDYIVYHLTGVLQADCSIATFSCYFDIYGKCYWQEMLTELGISEAQLPPLVEPCTIAGTVRQEIAASTGLSTSVRVNHGALDHFTGMIGCGNVCPGKLSLSTGTVMALATMADTERGKNSGVAMHYGFLPNTYIMLPVAESGGVALEWFKRTCMEGVSYDTLNDEVAALSLPSQVVCLPYLVGTNAPEFDTNISGLFYGLRAEHSKFHMAAAVMEGVAFLLRKNCDALKEKGILVKSILATGGGAKSALWCQMQADITGLPVILPKEKEAACYGSGIVAAVAEGLYANFAQATAALVQEEKQFIPRKNQAYEGQYRKFCTLYSVVAELEGL